MAVITMLVAFLLASMGFEFLGWPFVVIAIAALIFDFFVNRKR